MTGFSKEKISEQISNMLQEITSTVRIGRSISINKLARELNNIDGLVDCNIYSKNATGNEIYCKADDFLRLKEVTVNCFYD
jgi:hypothetical protein